MLVNRPTQHEPEHTERSTCDDHVDHAACVVQVDQQTQTDLPYSVGGLTEREDLRDEVNPEPKLVAQQREDGNRGAVSESDSCKARRDKEDDYTSISETEIKSTSSFNKTRPDEPNTKEDLPGRPYHNGGLLEEQNRLSYHLSGRVEGKAVMCLVDSGCTPTFCLGRLLIVYLRKRDWKPE